MLSATSNTILVQQIQDKKAKILGTESFSKTNINQQNIQQLNTIKINFNKMAKTKPKNEPFSQCQCKAIMIKDDENLKFKKQDENFTWYCRFCGRQNKSKQIYFSQNNTKFVLQKNVQRGILPPILLFLIDLSGSMGQSITAQYENSGGKEQDLITASKQLLQMIKKSIFYQKNFDKFKDYKTNPSFKLQEQQLKKTKVKGSQYYSKITFFMSVIENYLQKLKNQSLVFKEFRIGFIFFNEVIYLLKANKQRLIPTYLSKKSQFSKDFPFQKNLIDFDDYDQIFNAGQKCQRFFADSRLKSADLSKLLVQNIDTQGQTALGPALAFALGVASSHDYGSRIVLISDAQPNIGILSQDNQESFQSYKKIQKIIKQRKLTIGILNWITQQGKSYQQRSKTPLSKFFKQNKQHIKQISLDFSLRMSHTDVLETAKKTLQNFISRGTIGQLLSINVFTSNPKIEVSPFKYDTKNFKYIKFLGLQDKTWVQIKVKKLSEQDYLFPIYIQLVAEYEDVLTKQKLLYVSYTRQKIISTKVDKQVYQYLDSGNKHNIRELQYLQKLFHFDRQKIIPESISSRNMQNSSIELKFNDKNKPLNLLEFSSICTSLNSLAELENRRSYDQDEQYL